MLAPIVVGFAMATLGVAMLFLGEVPFVAGRRIPALRSRLIGLVLVSFLPLAFGLHQLLGLLFGHLAVDGPTVTWSLFSLCWLTVTVILFRVLVPKRERKVEKTMADPFGEPAAPIEEIDPVEEPKPLKKVSVKQPAKKGPAKKPPTGPEESSPFDFS